MKGVDAAKEFVTGREKNLKSSMTIFKHKGVPWEWTLLLDTFNNEILAHQATSIPGSNKPYYHCLERLKLLIGKKEEQTPQVVFPTRVLSTPHGLFARPTNIITYFGQCHEREIQQIIQ